MGPIVMVSLLTSLVLMVSTAAQDPGTSAQTAGRWKSTARHGLDCPQSIKAREGGSVTIQCRVDPTINLTSCTVVLQLVGNSTPVYVYRHGNDDPDPALEDYRGRVTHNKDLPKGVMTLQISFLNRSDSGPYGVNINGRRTCNANLTVEEDQQEDDVTTTPPPKEDDPAPSDDPTREKMDVRAVAGGVGGVVGALLLLLTIFILVKRGKIQVCKTQCRGQEESENPRQRVDYTRGRKVKEDLDGVVIHL